MTIDTRNTLEEHFRQEGERALAEVIDRNIEDLQTTWNSLFPDVPFSEFQGAFKKKREKGDLTADYFLNNFAERAVNTSTTPELDVLFRSYALTQLACEARDRSDYEKSWSYIASARYHAGEFTAEGLVKIRCANEQSLRTRAAKGGDARAKKYEPAKQEVIRLLKEKRPESGWKSPAEAVNAIYEDVVAFIKKNRDGSSKTELAQSALKQTLRRWMHHDERVSCEFNLLTGGT